MDYGGARALNVLLGTWLLVTPALWPHVLRQTINTAVVGLLVVIVALWSLGTPKIRLINAALGIWLGLSSFVMPATFAVTRWNNVVIGIAIALVALVGPRQAGANATRT